MKKFLVTTFGSFFYTGFFPFAPASFASGIWLLIWLFVPGAHWMTHWIAIVGLLPIAVVLSDIMEKYYGEDASCIVIDSWLKSTPPIATPIGGMRTSLTNEDTILPKAPPIMIPTAISTTFPRMAKSLNSDVMLILILPVTGCDLVHNTL